MAAGTRNQRGGHRGARRRSSTGARRSRRSGRRNQRSDLTARLMVAIPAIAVVLFAVISGGLIFTVFLFGLGAVGMHELFAMFRRAHPVRLAGFLGLAGLLVAAQYGTSFSVLLAAVAVVPVLFGLTLVQRHPSTAGMAVTLLGVYWIAFALAHAVMLRRLPHGEGIIIDVLVGTFVGDTFAYLGGRMFGARQLAPHISQNKTVEGMLIGMVAAVLGVWFAGRYQDWLPGTHALILGVGVALAAPVGDLFESFIKRGARTKDTGRLFGAHGGALDRMDAALFTAVVGYYIWAAYV